MRLQIIATRKPAPADINYSLCQLLREKLAENKGVTLTDKAPDIAHVFGDWDNKTASLVKSFHNCRIPIIYTSLKGLQAVSAKENASSMISIKRNRSEIANRISVFHVCGEKERQAVERKHRKTATKLIYNPSITAMATPQDTISKTLALYEETVASHDQHIRQTIAERVKKTNVKETNICEICCQILYIQYLMLRGGITQELLDALSSTMMREQYDEDIMAETLKRLDMTGFTASLLPVLGKRAALTEGFMPIAAVNNKLTDSIENNILTI